MQEKKENGGQSTALKGVRESIVGLEVRGKERGGTGAPKKGEGGRSRTTKEERGEVKSRKG